MPLGWIWTLDLIFTHLIIFWQPIKIVRFSLFFWTWYGQVHISRLAHGFWPGVQYTLLKYNSLISQKRWLSHLFCEIKPAGKLLSSSWTAREKWPVGGFLLVFYQILVVRTAAYHNHPSVLPFLTFAESHGSPCVACILDILLHKNTGNICRSESGKITDYAVWDV